MTIYVYKDGERFSWKATGLRMDLIGGSVTN